MIYDVAIVGAGPAGSMAAYTTARKGLKTLLIEEHKEVGKPPHCTGKLTTHAFREFDLPRESILNSVKSAVFYSPNNVELYIRRKEIDSYILDRELFDQKLAERAVSAGAELILETKVYDVSRSASKLLNLKSKMKGVATEFRSRLLIDAEGATPRLLKKFGLKAKKNPLVGLQYEISNVDFRSSDCVELYFGRHIAPGFFVWIVPTNNGRARVGLCIGTKSPKTSAYKHLKWFMKYHPIASRKLRNGKIEKAIVGRVPTGLINRSFTDGVLVVGDSAGHVKPTTGGGIYFALKGGEISGETAVKCSTEGDFSSKCLQTYETTWKSLIGGELRFTSLARKILNSLWDEDLDRMFQLIAEDKRIVETIETYGDTAYQSRLLRPVIREMARASLTKISDTLFLSRVMMRAITAMLI